jgi:16S rRNA (guanine966-N2)-methyltransferase
MKITSGQFAGIPITAPRGEKIRPTLGKIKQAVFNMIRADIPETVCLDIFAGTGAYGLEAISNGAAKAVFIEKEIGMLIAKNCEKLKIEKSRYRILNCGYKEGIEKLEAEKFKADIIFTDPPYNKGYINAVVLLMEKSGILKNQGLLVLEVQEAELNGLKVDEELFRVRKNKKYGDKNIIILQKN